MSEGVQVRSLKCFLRLVATSGLFKTGVYHLEGYGASIVVTKHNPAWEIAGCAIHDGDSDLWSSLCGLDAISARKAHLT
jgi:hypothetical protein